MCWLKYTLHIYQTSLYPVILHWLNSWNHGEKHAKSYIEPLNCVRTSGEKLRFTSVVAILRTRSVTEQLFWTHAGIGQWLPQPPNKVLSLSGYIHLYVSCILSHVLDKMRGRSDQSELHTENHANGRRPHGTISARLCLTDVRRHMGSGMINVHSRQQSIVLSGVVYLNGRQQMLHVEYYPTETQVCLICFVFSFPPLTLGRLWFTQAVGRKAIDGTLPKERNWFSRINMAKWKRGNDAIDSHFRMFQTGPYFMSFSQCKNAVLVN